MGVKLGVKAGVYKGVETKVKTRVNTEVKMGAKIRSQNLSQMEVKRGGNFQFLSLHPLISYYSWIWQATIILNVGQQMLHCIWKGYEQIRLWRFYVDLSKN